MKSFSHSSLSNTVPNLKVLSFLSRFFVICIFAASSAFSYAQCLLATAPANTAIWTGEASNDWCNAANWACGKIPDETTNVIVPAGAPFMPVVSCTFSFNGYAANVDVQAGATLTIPASKTLNLRGNFVSKDESRYVLTGRVNFSGADQEIPGFIYNNVTISGGGVKMLAGEATVNGSLILTNGVVVTSNTNLLTLGAKGLVTAAFAKSYIDGPFRRITNSVRTYSFPVGSNGEVKSVSISPLDETESGYTVNYHQAVVPNNGVFGCTNLMANLATEYWEVARTSTAADALVQVDYEASADPKNWSSRKSPADGSSVALIQNVNGKWNYNGDASEGLQAIESVEWQNSGQVSAKLESASSRFTFGYGYTAIRPVKLLNFTAIQKAKTAEVNWSLEQGDDQVETELQHSTDDKHYEKLTSLQTGSGIANTYTHNNLGSGVHYYRLFITDKARNTSYSQPVKVVMPDFITRIKGMKATTVRNQAYVNIESASEQVVGISLFDMAGRVVSQSKVNVVSGDNSLLVNMMKVTPGVYNLYVQTADGVKGTLRFIKVNY